MKLSVATRGSPLALIQTESVCEMLKSAAPDGLHIEQVIIQTEGDLKADMPISELGGKAVFASALEQAVLAGDVDIAVHSAKDLPAHLPTGLAIGAVSERADPRDVLVGVNSLDELPKGALVAAGAARRKIQLSHLRPDLKFVELRGNIETRLKRLEHQAPGASPPPPAAAVIAKAALDRLNLNPKPGCIFEVSQMLPQVGQGFLAVQYRENQNEIAELLAAVDNSPARQLLTAERGFLKELGGDCNIPAAAYAEFAGASAPATAGQIQISGMLFQNTNTSSHPAFKTITSQLGSDGKTSESPEALGRRLAKALL